MVQQLTTGERQNALVILLCIFVVGLAMAALGGFDPFGVHGVVVMLYSGGIAALVMKHYYGPEPAPGRQSQYYDDPSRSASCCRGLGGLRHVHGRMGCRAARLARPRLRCRWSSFGRLRPTHTSGVIFGFGGNALIATSFHVVQRTSRARLAGQISPWFVLLGYNLFCVLAVSGYLMGVTQSKEYAEPEWYADIWLVIVWVTYFILYIAHDRPAEGAAHLRRQLVLHGLHPGRGDPPHRQQPRPPGLLGHAKSYTIWPGVQDAMVQWWYGHNAVAFFLTAGFLGMLYYYLPVRAQRPIFSYRLSILSFWGITFFYMWAGSHHLHYTALPHWVQTLGMTFSVMLLVPSWASAGNALLTLNGAWHRVRDDATLRFMMAAAVFYGLSTFEGSFLAIRPVNSLSHYTDWTVGHVHAGALGWVALITFGSLYTLVPALWKRERMYSAALVEVHFWLAIAGTLIYVFAMWNSGIIQGLMWRTYTQEGTLAYSFVNSLVADVSLLHRPRLRRPAVPARRRRRLLQHLDDGALGACRCRAAGRHSRHGLAAGASAAPAE